MANIKLEVVDPAALAEDAEDEPPVANNYFPAFQKAGRECHEAKTHAACMEMSLPGGAAMCAYNSRAPLSSRCTEMEFAPSVSKNFEQFD